MVLLGTERGPALIAATRDLRARIEAAAEQIERDRLLPPDLVDALYDVGLFTMLLPRSLGGAETDLPTFISAVEEVARADASVAWCIGQANGLAAYTAYLDPSAAREVFAGQRTILANGPGQGNQPGQAIEVDGGYRVTGRWMFASGIGHATWLLAICNVVDGFGQPRIDPDGKPAQRLILLPKAEATLHDVWHVSGLRGTGSQSFSFDDAWAPATYAIHFAPQARRESGPLYLYSNNGIFGPAFGAVALGIAYTSLAELVAFAGGKVPRGVDRSIRDNAVVQAGVATAEARRGAARAYLHDTLREVWDAAAQTGTLTIEQRVAVRLAATHATQESAAVVETVFSLAGSHAIFESGPFARRFRDVHAVTQQLQARRAHYENVGRHLLDLEPDVFFL